MRALVMMPQQTTPKMCLLNTQASFSLMLHITRGLVEGRLHKSLEDPGSGGPCLFRKNIVYNMQAAECLAWTREILAARIGSNLQSPSC